MPYDPNQPRNQEGEWSDSGGSSKGSSSKGNRNLAQRIAAQHHLDRNAAIEMAKGAAIGVAQGIAGAAIAGAVTGGWGAPAVLAARAIVGARAGLHPALTVISAGAGAYGGLEIHKKKMKEHVANQHKEGK